MKVFTLHWAVFNVQNPDAPRLADRKLESKPVKWGFGDYEGDDLTEAMERALEDDIWPGMNIYNQSVVFDTRNYVEREIDPVPDYPEDFVVDNNSGK